MPIRIAGSLLALMLCVPSTFAQQVRYHWPDTSETEVWVWSAVADSHMVVLRRDDRTWIPQNVSAADSAAFVEILQDSSQTLWTRLAARLQHAAAQEQRAARQGRQPVRRFAAPQTPDLVINVLEDAPTIYVDFHWDSLTYGLTFSREGEDVVVPVPAEPYHTWLPSAFGQTSAEDLLPVARLFDPDRTQLANAASWDTIFAGWLAQLPPRDPSPLLYRADARDDQSSMQWARVDYHAVETPPEEQASSLGDQWKWQALPASIIFVVILIVLGALKWRNRNKPGDPENQSGQPKPDVSPKVQGDLKSLETAAQQLVEAGVIIREKAEKLQEKAEVVDRIGPHTKDLLDLLTINENKVPVILALSVAAGTWYSEHILKTGALAPIPDGAAGKPPSNSKTSTPPWYPKPDEAPGEWFKHLLDEHLPGLNKTISEQKTEIANLKTNLHSATKNLHHADGLLNDIIQGPDPQVPAAQPPKAAPDTPDKSAPEPPLPILDLNDKINKVQELMAGNATQIKDLRELQTLASSLHLGQRLFHEQIGNPVLDSNLTGLINYSLTELALALGTGQEQHARAMRANLYVITSTLHTHKRHENPGFKQALETLEAQGAEGAPEGLASSSTPRPSAKPFLVRLKTLRDATRLDLRPFFYVEDDGSLQRLG